MSWLLFLFCVLFVVWITRKSGPKKDQSYLNWLAVLLFATAVMSLTQRLVENHGSGIVLLWSLPLLGLVLLWEFRPGHRERRAARRAARRGTRAPGRGDRSSAKS